MADPKDASQRVSKELTVDELTDISGGRGFKHESETLVITVKVERIVIKNLSQFKGDKEYEEYLQKEDRTSTGIQQFQMWGYLKPSFPF